MYVSMSRPVERLAYNLRLAGEVARESLACGPGAELDGVLRRAALAVLAQPVA